MPLQFDINVLNWSPVPPELTTKDDASRSGAGYPSLPRSPFRRRAPRMTH
jgi:hypothetical protein